MPSGALGLRSISQARSSIEQVPEGCLRILIICHTGDTHPVPVLTSALRNSRMIADRYYRGGIIVFPSTNHPSKDKCWRLSLQNGLSLSMFCSRDISSRWRLKKSTSSAHGNLSVFLSSEISDSEDITVSGSLRKDTVESIHLSTSLKPVHGRRNCKSKKKLLFQGT